jgi:hypothetical protein
MLTLIILILMMTLNVYFAVIYFLKTNVDSGGSNAHRAKVGSLWLRWELRER